MNTTHPADYAPLSVGPGLAFGLMLLLRCAPGAGGRKLDDTAPTTETAGRTAMEAVADPEFRVKRTDITRRRLTTSGRR